ncbi:MAG: helix-turn-helix transcriptional regulator [Oscillospiraceae bacterium]|nr:helix-turn-helix transcriptional regulator [Oscillospiraceae bacterium]
MTIREVGDRAGISESFYCMIENGERRPSVETAKKIASVLGFDWTLFYPDDAKGA